MAVIGMERPNKRRRVDSQLQDIIYRVAELNRMTAYLAEKSDIVKAKLNKFVSAVLTNAKFLTGYSIRLADVSRNIEIHSKTRDDMKLYEDMQHQIDLDEKKEAAVSAWSFNMDKLIKYYPLAFEYDAWSNKYRDALRMMKRLGCASDIIAAIKRKISDLNFKHIIHKMNVLLDIHKN